MRKNCQFILVINKIDRSDARAEEVINEVYDLFIDLDATDEQIDFPIVYTNAKAGVAHNEINDESNNLETLFEKIISHIKGPEADDGKVAQFLITNLDYDNYVGRIAIGRLMNGVLESNKTYTLCGKNDQNIKFKISVLYTISGLKRTAVEKVEAGDIAAIAGMEEVNIGDTVSNAEKPGSS